MPESIYTFNNCDYSFVIRLWNGKNNIYLKPEAWEELLIEEDIFDWFCKGSIVINTPFDSFERDSDQAVSLFGDSTETVYKFRNDGRDTLYIYILPRADVNIPPFNNVKFDHPI